ncbi:hypothetical protein F5Y03DRAFT_341097 [Xylaria venustula]|nr:hypothetical protein F5Y03DRAFT_341097 [Xylaria venustula]
MHLILTGATGLVGSGVLEAMIKAPGVTKISILSRRPVKMADDAKDPRINVIIQRDFNQYDLETLQQLSGAQGCVWALGISQTQVSKEEYVEITKDYALAASRAFQKLNSPEQGKPFNFVYVSGYGATINPGRFTQAYARVKGETELALADIRRANPSFHASSFRPCAVDGTAHESTKPYRTQPPAYLKAITPLIMGPMRTLMPSLHSPTEPMGKFLVGMAMGNYEDKMAAAPDIEMVGAFPILENPAFLRLYGLSSK